MTINVGAKLLLNQKIYIKKNSCWKWWDKGKCQT